MADDQPTFEKSDFNSRFALEDFRTANGCVFATASRDSGATASVRPVEMESGADHVVSAVDYRGHEMEPHTTSAERALDELAETLAIVDEPYEHEYTRRVHMMVEAIWGKRARRDYELVCEENRAFGMTTAGYAEECGVEPIPETENITWGVYTVAETLNTLDRDETDDYDLAIPADVEGFSLPEFLSFETESSDVCGETATAVVDDSGAVRAESRALYTRNFDAFGNDSASPSAC